MTNIIERRSSTSVVSINRKTKIVSKRLLKKYSEFDLWQNEIYWLSKLKDFDRTPTIIQLEPKIIVMTYIGEMITKETIPEDWKEQRDYILKELAKCKCKHNDIKPQEITIQDGKLHLIDFGWATKLGDPIPSEWPKCLGDPFRWKEHEFDDKYSFNLSVECTKHSCSPKEKLSGKF